MLHRLREACAPDFFEMPSLEGEVEADETVLGGKVVNYSNERLRRYREKYGGRARGSVGKQVIFGMKQRGGLIVAFPVPDATGTTLISHIRSLVAPGTVIFTDESGAYSRLHRHYEHHTVNHSLRQWVKGPATTASVESFWALLKRSYHARVWFSFKHAHRYINEATFRLNYARRDSETLEVVDRILAGAVGKRLRYRELIQ